jgi:hypothetical protein
MNSVDMAAILASIAADKQGFGFFAGILTALLKFRSRAVANHW